MDDDSDFPGFQTHNPSPPSQWNTVAAVVTALAAILSAVTQAKDRPIYADVFLALAALAVVSVLYTPVVAWIRMRRLRARRNRFARKSWPELLGFERRLGAFINPNDSTNLSGMLISFCNQNFSDELAKLRPPNYIDVFYALLSQRHERTTRIRESEFRRAVTEFCALVRAYNDDYVLGSLKLLRGSSVFAALPVQNKAPLQEGIEDFRERWVKLLDDLKQFVDTANRELRYGPPHDAMNAYFERPKKLL